MKKHSDYNILMLNIYILWINFHFQIYQKIVTFSDFVAWNQDIAGFLKYVK